MTAVLSPQRAAQVCEGIRAALDEWERDVRKASPGRWGVWGMTVMASPDGSMNYDTGLDVAHTTHETGLRTFNADHIARHASPDRVLAQIADYRARVDECEAAIWAHAHKPHGIWVECNDCEYGADKGCPDARRASAALRRLADLTGVDSGE